ncbi:MAG: DNA polymerase IV [Streptococcaceae bacterium]|jgi:DNA polymerase-4|nr:DNA polymerase IV [Streptococcaceae bacterium]
MLHFDLNPNTSQKLIHIDMDAFFASVEQRDNPELRGKPVVIGRNPVQSGGRGVVSTCSYEARKFGIHSAMSAKEAYERCPQAVFVSGHYQKYSEVSHQVRKIFARYTDKIQMASIDEAYLEVTENKLGAKSAVKIAKLIQYDIYHELGLTCSAGVSYNKFLAKIASDWEKPHGLMVIKPEEALEFLAQLPVEKFHGVGKATVPKLHALGIFTGGDLQKQDPVQLAQRFGTYGWSLYQKSHGVASTHVSVSRNRKSLGKERTYGDFLMTEEAVKKALEKIARRVSELLQKYALKGNVVVVKLRDGEFQTLTKRKTIPTMFNDAGTLTESAFELIENYKMPQTGIRLVGITVSGFGEEISLLE